MAALSLFTSKSPTFTRDMEGFLSINWYAFFSNSILIKSFILQILFFSCSRDRAEDESNSFLFKDAFLSNSAAFHQLYQIPQSPWPSEKSGAKSTGIEDLNARNWNPNNLKRKPIEGVNDNGQVLKIEPPKPFLRKSILNSKEQKDYFFIILRIKKALMAGTPTDPNDVIKLKVCQHTMYYISI